MAGTHQLLAGGFAPDGVPASFTFTDVTSQNLSTVVTSNSITVSDINISIPITVSGGSYSINGGGFTTSAGTVTKNDTVRAQVTTGTNASTAYSVTVTIGGVSDTFTATTKSVAQLQTDQLTGSVTYTSAAPVSTGGSWEPSNGYVPLYDNSITTFMGMGSAVATANHWIRFQLPSAKRCQSLKVRPYSVGVSLITEFHFDGSSNGSSWTTLASNTAGGYADNTDYLLNPNNSTSYLYYRLRVTLSSAAGYDFSLRELEMLGY